MSGWRRRRERAHRAPRSSLRGGRAPLESPEEVVVAAAHIMGGGGGAPTQSMLPCTHERVHRSIGTPMTYACETDGLGGPMRAEVVGRIGKRCPRARGGRGRCLRAEPEFEDTCARVQRAREHNERGREGGVKGRRSSSGTRSRSAWRSRAAQTDRTPREKRRSEVAGPRHGELGRQGAETWKS